ncbi:hypothetical protein [Spiroplasma sp. SV19]|uniref:hypothetical protein n=1 Tax=Spiroplasma sp. SV19 TaxID=2570468 RepID=UPI0024B74A31|nr:hypothetical protein [Spiroplasma sp. SV19]WHQ37349.1 hypothetical protein E7Y35_05710 [Spiroplasma sp. SV19]
MRKLMKLLSAVVVVGSSSLTAIACKRTTDKTYTIQVQAEKEWRPFYEKAAKVINTKLAADKSKFKIEIKEIGTFDELGLFDKLPFTDSNLTDVFALPFDRFTSYVSENKLADMSTVSIGEFDERLGGDVDKDVATASDGKKYGVTLNIESLITVYNKTKLGQDLVKNLEDMTAKNVAEKRPVYNATLGDLWYGSLLYNTLATKGLVNVVEENNQIKSVETVFDYNNDDFKKVATSSYDFAQTLPESMFNVATRWVGGKGLYDAVLDGKTDWFIAGPWDYSKKDASGRILKTAGFSDEDTVFGMKRKDIAFESIDNYRVNNKQWKHFKGGFTLSMNNRLDRQQAKIQSAGKTKKEVATLFIQEILGETYAYDWYKYAGKITPYKNGLAALLAEAKKEDQLIESFVESIINGYANSTSRPIHSIFNGFWGVYEDNYNSRAFSGAAPNKSKTGDDYARTLSHDIANYIRTFTFKK